MADIVNLNKYRKARKRAEEAADAAENKIRHGRSKAEKSRNAEDVARSERDHDDKRIGGLDDDQEPA